MVSMPDGMLKLSKEQQSAYADEFCKQFIKDTPQAAAFLGLTKPKMEPRHTDVLEMDRWEEVSRKARDLDRRRSALLYQAKQVQSKETYRGAQPSDMTTVTFGWGDGSVPISITQQQALAGIERSVIDTEERLTTALYLMRDLIFAALGKLDYRPPIEAEA